MFKGWRSCLGGFILAAALWGSAAIAAAQPEMLAVDQLRPGMTGVARTVVTGTEISEFGVEILGIMKNKGPAGDLILVRTFGEAVERTGIAQGMSGSPVYIEGKLIGAIAYGWSLTDHKIGMVTPIADMLKLWSLPDRRGEPKPPVVPVEEEKTADSKEGEEKQEETKEPRDAVQEELLPDEGKDMKRPVAGTVLMTNGFSQRSLEMLRDKLKPFRLEPVAAGEAPEGVAFGPLQPGSAVGVQLVRGDVSVGALGTVTYVEGDKVLAFGHPFLKKGNIGFFMTNAYVFTTVNGLENSFKVGAVGEPIGVINQDRGAAVAGEANKYPAVVPFRVQVQDKDIQRNQDAAFQVIKDEELTAVLAVTSVFNVAEKTMDRVGPGTAKVRFAVSSKGLPGEEFVRENMFYSPGNIAEFAVGELYEFLAMLSSNQYQAVDIMDVRVDVTVEEPRRTAAIVEAKALNKTVKAGETVQVEVKLQPFRGEAVKVQVPFVVPKERRAGNMTLEVRGGGMVPLMQLLLRQQGLDENLFNVKERRKVKSFGEIIKEWRDRDRNDEIVVEVLDMPEEEQLAGEQKKKGTAKTPGPVKKAEQTLLAELIGQPKEPKDAVGKKTTATKENGRNKPKGRLVTEYIIDRDLQVTVEVLGDKPVPPPKKTEPETTLPRRVGK